MNIFLGPESLRTNAKVELDLSNYATKADLKNTAGFDQLITDSANLKSDKLDIDKLKNLPSSLNNFKYKVDKLDIRKLETTVVGLSKPSNVVKANPTRQNYVPRTS